MVVGSCADTLRLECSQLHAASARASGLESSCTTPHRLAMYSIAGKYVVRPHNASQLLTSNTLVGRNGITGVMTSFAKNVARVPQVRHTYDIMNHDGDCTATVVFGEVRFHASRTHLVQRGCDLHTSSDSRELATLSHCCAEQGSICLPVTVGIARGWACLARTSVARCRALNAFWSGEPVHGIYHAPRLSKRRGVVTLISDVCSDFQVVMFHVFPHLLNEAGAGEGKPNVSLEGYSPLARLGGNTYALLGSTFDLLRPRVK